MPHKYQVKQHFTYSTKEPQLLSALFDIRRWSELMGWTYLISPERIYFSTPSQGVGAHAVISHALGQIELSVTEQTQNRMQFSVLFADEHNAKGTLSLAHQDNSISVTWHISGSINTPIIGGYTALYIEFYLRQMLISAFNNLQTDIKLRTDK